MKQKAVLAALMAVSLLGTVCAQSSSAQSSSAAFRFMALGDMPYTLPGDYPRLERLIAGINGQKPEFSIHVGDIKSGSSECSDANFQKVLDSFGTFAQPLVYTPGDNEWTDCHRERAGKFDPLERLAKVRSMFYQDSRSLGGSKLTLERQTDLMPEHKQMVENARWSKNGVLFTTVHVVGSNNGFERNAASVAEYFARDKANVDWIKASFDLAVKNGAPAMVFAFQADMDFAQTNPYAVAGFAGTIAAFKAGAATFKKPILLLHGDSHYLLIDNPLIAADGKRLENVTRLMVMGAEQVQAVEVGVNPSSAGVFSFAPMIVPENINFPK